MPYIPDAEIAERFEYHPPTSVTVAANHGSMREAFKELAIMINHNLEDGREKSLALTALEEGMHWTNSSIAKNQTPKQ